MPVTSNIESMAAAEVASSAGVSSAAAILSGPNDDGNKPLKVVSVPSSGAAGSNVPNRLFRSFVLFDNRDFLPRPFQVCLFGCICAQLQRSFF